MKEDHSCCHNELPKGESSAQAATKSLKSYLVGVGAAFLACLCCSLALIPLMLGLSGALIFKEQLGPYHTFFEAAAVIMLVGACVYMWKDHKKSGKSLKSLIMHIVVTLGMYGLMTFVMNQWVAPALSGETEHLGVHGNHVKGKI